MRAVVQRVTQARVEIAGEVVGSIERGLLVLLAVSPADAQAQADWLVDKLLGLRIFADAAGKMNLDVNEVQGGLLVVSQFTLLGDVSRGRRPSFIGAAPPEQANGIYEYFLSRARSRVAPVACGRFGADMQIHLINDGPVTLIIDAPTN